MPKKSVAGTAQDPTIRFASLTIDDQVYKLAYSFNSIAVAESVSGCNLLQGFMNMGQLTAVQLRGLFYASLLIAQPHMTIEDAGSLLRADTMLAVYEALAESYNLSTPEKKRDEQQDEEAGGN